MPASAMDTTQHLVPWLGLTGGIGSGKSTALAYLRQLGAAVISSDDIVHGLYSRPDIVAALLERFGGGVVQGQEIDRRAVARIVFGDREQLVWLQDLLYPHVEAAIDAWGRVAQEAEPRPCLLAVEVPLLFEAGLAAFFDYVMLITAPGETRRGRLTAKLTDSEFASRVAAQMPEEEKMAHSDFVFHNTGSRKALRDFLGQAVAQVISGDADVTPPAGEGARRR